ncbi:glutaredoxin-like protein NrdH [Pseudoclavibacter sp. CFCC 14310]|uniref:glutaredoxin-like protein NrdH n=1 Tax=Pseudoclavibacter sp. CFCC 14310 TaxID=2615180 RepID=UPI00130112AC|nr:glutaredoxin-like protein NrdH [Pseudoclavibacter sp. CFCC 14310]KAB1646192.1 glutaredoxin-like protein NrdH [Pseudoclavibacter sp. CFCC 14310]
MSVTVFSKPACVQCSTTYRALTKRGIEYETIDITKDEAALQKVKELGYLQAPVVLTDEGVHWSGFRPDLIEKYLVEPARQHAAAAAAA